MSRVSVVIPVHNEAENLPELCARLLAVLDGIGREYEVIFVDDGSRDGSLELLRAQADLHPGSVRVVELSRNFGQHPAILAGFQQARGDVVVTLDADLQNPPEEIPKLLALADAGFDVVGGVRRKRQDSFFRRAASALVNRITCSITGMKLSDYGCMLRAYSREIVDEINRCEENATFIPALAMSFARRPVEVPVAHAARAKGGSKYSLYHLVRLNFDLMTGFSLVPLQMLTLLGAVVSVGGLSLGVYLLVRRFVLLRQAEAEGLFTLFALAFVVMGVLMAGLGIVGEYIGRIYQEVRGRPRFLVRNRYGFDVGAGSSDSPHPPSAARGARPRVLVFAYSDVGHACLEWLLERGRNIIAVYTHEDAPSENIWFPSVAALAQAHGIEVSTVNDLRSASEVARIRALAPDLILSFYYRHLLPEPVLALPQLGAFNMHGSLLPKYRGRAPVNWAVLRGEKQTGATLHVMESKPDAGDTVDQEPVPIGPDDTAAAVQSRITAAALRILARRIDDLEAGCAPRRQQDAAQATYYGRRRPEDGAIDWTRPAREVHDLVRAVTHPYPGAYTDTFGKRTWVWSTRLANAAPAGTSPGQMYTRSGRPCVACGDGDGIEIVRAQQAGSAEMDGAELLQPAAPRMKGTS